MVTAVLFWLCTGLLAWVYLGYPLLALAYGRLRPVRLSTVEQWPDLVSVGIAVHDGGPEIDERMTNVLDQAPPFGLELIVASDGSTDDTAEMVRRRAETDSRIRLLDLPRVGQSAAQSAIFEAARGDIVVLTDIETRYVSGCLADLVAPFADPAVGCTTGVLRWHYDRRTQTAYHEGLYWRYEQRVRAWESRSGWLAAATGALLAARRSLFRPVAAHASLDQMLPLLARQAGLLVLARPEAIGWDQGTFGLDDQFRSRTRIATQGIEANLRVAFRVRAWRRPGTLLAIWSHKLLRWATPILGVSSAGAGAALYAAGESALYLLPAVAALVVMVAAGIGILARRLGVRVPLTGFALTIVAVNAAFGLAWLNVILRRRVGAWKRA